ncbi:NADAR family protein [Phenylobacterium sp.]|uniref:NADAR family protein n=1 Tax=Phenylobacterium sp. TaxID=1871053 RepID=UPI0035B3DC50
MRVLFKRGLLILAPDDDDDGAEIARFGEACEGHVFRMMHSGAGVQFIDLGPEDEARNLPLNITSASPPPLDLISNFAAAPFALDGRRYASVESFWQSLKPSDPAERDRLAALPGAEAKREGQRLKTPPVFDYDGAAIRSGTADHWGLMQRACEAKFAQNPAARQALALTGARPLVHKVRRDSRVIPGVVMAEIWMKVRARMAGSADAPGGAGA